LSVSAIRAATREGREQRRREVKRSRSREAGKAEGRESRPALVREDYGILAASAQKECHLYKTENTE